MDLWQQAEVLVAGGAVAVGPVTTSVAELYDPKTDTFSGTASMTESRQQHTATLLPDGKVLLIGGYSSEVDGDVRSAELWFPSRLD